MAQDDQAPRLNAHEKRFEMQVGDSMAVLTYQDRPNGTRVFLHTEVPPPIEGHGVGTQLVKAALDEAKEAGRHIVAQCPFVASYIARHPEYESLTQ
jgi:predicted GNAT family acetyltransferase